MRLWPTSGALSLIIGSTHEYSRMWPAGDSICGAAPRLRHREWIARFHKRAARDRNRM